MPGESRFDTHRQNYPRFVVADDTEAFRIPIQEDYHDVLYPDLRQPMQFDLFDPQGRGNGPKRPEKLRFHRMRCEVPIDINQALLIASFRRSVPMSGLVVLDGHTIIDTPTGITEVGTEVFRAIEVCRFVVLVAPPEIIIARRNADHQRKRPERTSKEIHRQQEQSLASARLCLSRSAGVENYRRRNSISAVECTAMSTWLPVSPHF